MVAKVGEKSITKRELAMQYGLPFADSSSKDSAEAALLTSRWEEAARDWVSREILLQEAQKRNLEQDQLFQQRIGRLKEAMLINRLYEMAAQDLQVDSAEVRADYGEHYAEYVSAADQIDLLYVLAPSRELANQARKSLQGGAPLDQVLTLSNELTGEHVGWVKAMELEPGIARAAFALPTSGLSYPQKRPDDQYIVLKCLQKRPEGAVLPLEEVYEQIRTHLVLNKQAEVEKALRDSLWSVYHPEIKLPSRKPAATSEK